ncbi:hypothetical protein O3M35_012757 [Rhynocoris fuscipes]|uniref:RNA (guanine-9-)-methyltransferase domain-containing protein 1 n=1 Tax=Rhynocoris fuscipes TaxID=488301 RepID=A0AAW1CU71_9HEMI
MFGYLRKVGTSLLGVRFVEAYKCMHSGEQIISNTSRMAVYRKHFSTDSFYSNIDYNAITKGDESLLKKLKIIMLEVEVLRQSGGRVPEKMSTERWIDVVNMKSKSQRFKQLAFWWLNEKRREGDKEKKVIKRAVREESLKNINKENGHIYYGFGGSTIFLRVYDSTIDRWKNSRLIQAMQFNPTLVIDCGYEQHMNTAELNNCAKQLVYVFSENRSHDQPFNLYLCNASRENRLLRTLNKLIPTLYDDDFPLNITANSYTDIFPKEKLVYLTPHCNEELKQFNDDDIYIIGAMVDKTNQEPLSLAKAKSEQVRMAKLPLDRYLDWGIGTKSLTINQCLKIMLDVRVSGDWEKALVHVPKRKIKTEEQVKELIRRQSGNYYSNSEKAKQKQFSNGAAKPTQRRQNNNLMKQLF